MAIKDFTRDSEIIFMLYVEILKTGFLYQGFCFDDPTYGSDHQLPSVINLEMLLENGSHDNLFTTS